MWKGVSVVGGGVWGRALAQVLAFKQEVLLYSLSEVNVKLENPNVRISCDIESLKGSKYLFLVVPSSAMRAACDSIKSIVDASSCSVIICSKGIEIETGLLMSEVVSEFFPTKNITILSGPNFAAEIADGLPAITSIVAENLSFAKELAKEFSTTNFKFIPATNVVMAQLFGAVKNVLAILCGVVRGMELGENLAAALVTVGVKDIMQLSRHKNKSAGGDLFLEPAGIGDMFLTCSSVTSRNNKFGVDLVSRYYGKNYQEIFSLENITVEGVSTILALKKWHISLPLMDFAHNLIQAKYRNKEEITRELQNIILEHE